MKAKQLLLTALVSVFALSASAQANLSGVYEADKGSKQMYVDIDFLNGGVPDFTQQFRDKTAKFKIVPDDFMNAKKLKKNFAGTKSEGFVRFKEKTLWSTTTEMRLSNPVLKDGVLTADWESSEGEKGKCFVIANGDGSIQIKGLMKGDRSLTPDDVVLTLAKNKLPEGTAPYVTPKDKYDYIALEYKKMLGPQKGDAKNGIPKVRVTIADWNMHRTGDKVMFFPVWTNYSSKTIDGIVVNTNDFEANEFAMVDGEGPYHTGGDKTMFTLPADKEKVSFPMWVSKVPLDARKISRLTISGRAQNSERATEKNPYGDFEYKFSNLEIPRFAACNQPGFVVADTDLKLEIKNIEKVGNNLVVTFTLTNESKYDKQIFAVSTNNGTARSAGGEELATSLEMGESLPAGETVKGVLTVINGANETIKTLRHPLNMRDRRYDYNSMLFFRGN